VTGLERTDRTVVVVRRCADLADLLAAAATGQGRAAVLSADLRSLGGEALSRLALAGVAVVALVEPGDDAAQRRLHQLGVREVLPADAAAEQVADAVVAAVQQVEQRERVEHREQHEQVGQRDQRDRAGGATPDPASEAPGATSATSATRTAYADPRRSLAARGTGGEPTAGPDGAGRVVVVWGPAGAPGRTTTAIGLAAEVAAAGGACLLVDADTYAGSVAQLLGLLDEVPGLATAARSADHGTLDVGALAALAPQVTPGLRVLTGLVSASRWPEVRPASFAVVLRAARGLTACTVVDTSASLEQDEELSYDTAAPRRNGVTLQALQDADVVVAVGSADPVGLQRLVRGLQELAGIVASPPVVVVNRVRASAVGPAPERAVRRALARYAGVDDPVLVPDDGAVLDAAVLQGRTLPEAAPSSPVRAAHARLAARLGVLAEQHPRAATRGVRRLRGADVSGG
jgi:MinD-like ATPase involved in chromosome partitioning or flagellar assembly